MGVLKRVLWLYASRVIVLNNMIPSVSPRIKRFVGLYSRSCTGLAQLSHYHSTSTVHYSMLPFPALWEPSRCAAAAKQNAGCWGVAVTHLKDDTTTTCPLLIK